jgi:hypothetical protein
VVGTGTDGGIFLDGPQSIRTLGSDGLFNTTVGAAQPIETMKFPGPDQILNTADDVTVSLAGYTREILIRDVAGEIVNGVSNLRSVTVTVTYQGGLRKYTLVTYISNYS